MVRIGYARLEETMTYAEQIKDPRWQKKRLEIMERDKFMCRSCFSEEDTLHVHHTMYFKNRLIFDYDNRYLLTLCEDCHESITIAINNSKELLAYSQYWSTDFFYELVDIIKILAKKRHNPYTMQCISVFLDKATSDQIEEYIKTDLKEL